MKHLIAQYLSTRDVELAVGLLVVPETVVDLIAWLVTLFAFISDGIDLADAARALVPWGVDRLRVMSEPPTTVPFPTSDRPETSYTARSGGTVLLRFVRDDLAEVRLEGDPSYLAQLSRDGGFFSLVPAPGVRAVSALNIDEADLIEYF